MTKLDQQIRQVVGEVVDSAPIVDSMPLRQAGIDRDDFPGQRRRILVGAVASIAVAGLAFMAVGPGGGSGDDGIAATETADTQPTLLSDNQWPYPKVLPDGYEFDYAVRSVALRMILFISPGGDATLRMTVIEAPEEHTSGEEVVRSVEFDDATWHQLESGTRYVRSDGRLEVSFGEDTDRETAQAVLESIETVDEQTLPRPALPSPINGTFTEVAIAEANGMTDRLSVATDGRYYTSRTLGSGSCCTTFDDDEVIVVIGGEWPDTEVGSVVEGDGLMSAIVAPSVATIQINLTDGSTIIDEPQDINDSFPVNFIFTKIPLLGDELFSQVEAIVALDENGDELGRLSGDDLNY